ncbi:MAG: hypothetical protein QM734_11580 [Cyclobacteriaceae bacterium]
MKKDLISDVEVVELIGLAKENIVSSRLGLANGMEAIIVAQDDGSYIYEAKIPFKSLRINKSEVEILGVEFETGKMQTQIKNTNQNASGFGPNSGYRRGAYGSQNPMYYSPSGYQYNPFATPGYLFIPVKLK